MRLLGGLVSLVLLQSCVQTFNRNDGISSEITDNPTVPLFKEFSQELNRSRELQKLTYGSFCPDDIYSTYLRTEFQSLNIKPGTYGSKKQAKQNAAKIGPKAQFYARKILTGPLVPYFGAVPVVGSPSVDMWIQYYKTRGKEHFIKWFLRGEALREILFSNLKQEGLPQEFYYLAMIESGFSNTASSKMRATGTWQFMKSTAKHYGLKINHWVDERRDPVKSTLAAAKYLKDLYSYFGDWHLAMAAYNAGPGTVRRAIRQAQTQNFWELSETSYLRTETKNYVPKMLAALIISSAPEVHGFSLSVQHLPTLELTTINISKPTRLSMIAERAGVSLSELKRWNPELLGNMTPPQVSAPSSGYPLQMPVAYAERFKSISAPISIQEYGQPTIHSHLSPAAISSIALTKP